ncbi:hypothetical protein C8Q80DRAFT_1105397 [Daedaleopsis nitida]|nr:hypothetical protein C8Q80DRAFT_1105397 [Daedaleopsis nitida]
MVLLVTTILTTPLLKIPLLISHATGIYCGLTPPRAVPPKTELVRFTHPDLMSRTPWFQVPAATVLKYLLCAPAVAEAAVIVAQHVLAFLVPTAHGYVPGSLRLTGLSFAGCLFGFAGGFIRVWCHQTLGRYFTWQVAIRDDHQLVTSGPYAIVRHPSYTGYLLLGGGAFMLLFSPGSYLAESGMLGTVAGKITAFVALAYASFVGVSLLSRVPKEDYVLRKEFGEQWEAWARNTPYRLIPYLY